MRNLLPVNDEALGVAVFAGDKGCVEFESNVQGEDKPWQNTAQMIIRPDISEILWSILDVRSRSGQLCGNEEPTFRHVSVKEGPFAWCSCMSAATARKCAHA